MQHKSCLMTYFSLPIKPMNTLKKYAYLSLALLLISTNASSNTVSQTDSQPAGTQEWVVVLKDPRPARLQGWTSNKYRSNSNYTSGLELKRMSSRFAKKNGLKLKQEWFIESLSVYCLIVEFTKDSDETLQELQNNKSVEWVQKSNEFGLLSAKESQDTDLTTPTINTEQSNKTTFDYDGQGTVIAMIDSGIDKQHQDLSHAIKSVTDFVITKPENSNLPQAEVHGTAIAGVLIAQPNDKFGIAGIAPAAKLLAFRGCWEETTTITNCNTLSLARALDAVIKLRPDILNLSLSGPHDPLLNKLIDKVIKNRTIIVAAFDPTRANSKRFPSPMKGVLIVRADSMDTQYESEFTAPGAQIVTTPDDNYTYLTGHSIASAHTSGLLALLTQASSQNPKFQATINLAMNGKLQSTNPLLEQLRH